LYLAETIKIPLKVSVITACFNSAATIEDTLRSVTNQDYPDLEYILIDGASSDGTSEIIQRYQGKIAFFVSEKDKGIYDALNKGIKAATGDLIAILHADDLYAHTSVISHVVKRIQEEGSDSLYGDLHYVDRSDTTRVIRNWKSGAYEPRLFYKGWMPPHPAFFLKRWCYEKHGSFHTDFRTAADYELMLRMLEKHQISTSYLPEVLVKMRVGGMSNVSLKNRIKANREDRKAWQINGLKAGWFTLIRKPLSKIFQFLK
jgi:glycosyltransferase involved in cell wall biosynthesis